MSQQSDTPNNSGHDPSLEDIVSRLDSIEKALTKLSLSSSELLESLGNAAEKLFKKMEVEIEELRKDNQKRKKFVLLEEFERGAALFLPPPYIDDNPDDDDYPCPN